MYVTRERDDGGDSVFFPSELKGSNARGVRTQMVGAAEYRNIPVSLLFVADGYTLSDCSSGSGRICILYFGCLFSHCCGVWHDGSVETETEGPIWEGGDAGGEVDCCLKLF